MALRRSFWLRFFVLGVCSLVLVGIAAAAMPLVKEWWQPKGGESNSFDLQDSSIRLVAGQPNTFTLSPGVIQTLKIQVGSAERASHPRQLRLSGSLAFDPNYQVRVRSRFAGEIIDPGYLNAHQGQASSVSPETQSLRPGDKVEKGQLMAVLSSKELGEKKSELIDALSQMFVDQKILDALAENRSSVPPRSIIEQEAKVAVDRNAVLKFERTLRVFRLSQEEIDDVKQEAARLHKQRDAGLSVKEKDWARVEIRAPFAGTIMEKNITVGDYVDTNVTLYQLADLTHLTVWAHAYEEDLPALQALTPQQRRWTIQLPAELPGTISKIGDLIDPTQHTAMVIGQVTNTNGQMRPGQFITAVIDLPPPGDEVEIPTSALIEDGSASVVIVELDADHREFALRRVAVARRTSDWVSLRTHLKPDEKGQGIQALQPGERLVSSGALELASALKDIQGTIKQ